MKKDCSLGIRLPTDMREKLERIAEEHDLSVGWLVRKAIAEYLKQNHSIAIASEV